MGACLLYFVSTHIFSFLVAEAVLFEALSSDARHFSVSEMKCLVLDEHTPTVDNGQRDMQEKTRSMTEANILREIGWFIISCELGFFPVIKFA